MNKKGFTLAEFAVALIVITMLLAASAPTITKKLSTKPKANANQITTNCTDNFSADCKSCYEHKCVSCKKNFTQGYAIIQNTCTYKKCSEIHSGCVDMCTEYECLDSTVKITDWKYTYQ